VNRPTNLAYYLVTALLALTVVVGSFLILNTTVGALRGGDLPVGMLAVDATVPPDHVGPLPRGIEVHEDALINAELTDPTSAQLVLGTGTVVGPFALLLAVLWLLRGLARSVREGAPFGSGNVRRLRLLGFLLLLGTPVVAILNWTLRLALANTAPLSDLSTTGLSIEPAPFVAALGAFVLAEVFAHGLRLREDVEATI
jgi:hypothetical protein